MVKLYKQYIGAYSYGNKIPRRTRHRLIAKRKCTTNFIDISNFCWRNAATNVDVDVTTAEISEDIKIPGNETQDEEDIQDDNNDCSEKECHNGWSKVKSDIPNSSEISLLLLSFSIRHNLTKQCLSDLLILLRSLCPERYLIPSSLHTLEQQWPINYDLSRKYYFCDVCNEGLDFDLKRCEKCQTTNEGENFFYMMDIKSSITTLLCDDNVKSNLAITISNRKTESTVLSDIVDGQNYKKIKMNEDDFTLTANTDGVPVFKSNQFSIWPILLSVNELPYYMRRKNIILAALWFGRSKPNFDIFFLPFVLAMKCLANDPIKWTHLDTNYESNIFVTQFVADSVARCNVQGVKQFNGSFGCTWCETEGETLTSSTNQRSRKRVYLPSKCLKSAKRNHFNFIQRLKEFAILLETSKRDIAHHYGIKSASKLLELPKFDIVEGFTIDYMHTVLLGVTRTITSAWMDSKYHAQPFYIGNKQKLIDALFLKILVPFETSRATRSIKEIRFWKSSEWRTWLFCVPFVLKNILQKNFFDNFLKFVFAIYLMNQENIDVSEISKARKLIITFVKGVENLYGSNFCSYNLHLLLHVCDCVQNWGPLWSYSAFQFEHFNGILLNSFNGNTHVPLQMTKKICKAAQAWQVGKSELIKNEQLRSMYFYFLDSKKYLNKFKRCDKFTFLGNNSVYHFNAIETHILRQYGFDVVKGTSYNSCIIFDSVFNSHQRMTENRCNCIISNDAHQTFIIQTFVHVISDDVEESFAIANKMMLCETNYYPFLYKVINIIKSPSVIKLTDIVRTKYYAALSVSESISHLIRLPNITELE